MRLNLKKKKASKLEFVRFCWLVTYIYVPNVSRQMAYYVSGYMLDSIKLVIRASLWFC